MKKLALHPATRRQLEAIVSSPPHAILLVSPSGMGKKTLATALAEEILQLEDLSSYPYALVLAPEKSISIEAIRELNHFLSLKVIGKNPPNRVVIIEDAQNLTLEAQNALLKTLEEPPQGTILILTVGNAQALLPTIRSRMQAININRPAKADLRQLYKDTDEAAFNQVYLVSGGAVGLLHALLTSENHPLIEATDMARRALNSPTHERLLLVDELSKQPDLARDFLTILMQMADIGLLSASGSTASKWQRVLSASYEASDALSKNAQAKLVMTNLMLGL